MAAASPVSPRIEPASGARPGALAGIRIVDLTINVLGPVATQILGDMGAEVIKVEPPAGDLTRHIGHARNPKMGVLYLNVNRNKQGIILDLKRPAAVEALMRLAETADVFVHSMRPQAAERLGISYSAVAARNPGIVYAFAPGYHPDGRYRDRPSYDDVIQGESGIAGLCDLAYGEPRYFPTVIADKFCGHALASAIGIALLARERTGEGQEVQVPMYETMVSFLLHEHLWEGAFDEPSRHMGYDRLLTRHRRPYPTKDGYICLMASNDVQWNRLFAAMDRPELANDPRFGTLVNRALHIDELYGIVAHEMTLRTNAEWADRLEIADIPYAPMKKLEELRDDPYLAETGFFRRYEHPTEGPMVTTAIPTLFSKTPGGLNLPPPNLGEHTVSVLASLGYSEAEIAALAG